MYSVNLFVTVYAHLVESIQLANFIQSKVCDDSFHESGLYFIYEIKMSKRYTVPLRFLFLTLRVFIWLIIIFIPFSYFY